MPQKSLKRLVWKNPINAAISNFKRGGSDVVSCKIPEKYLKK